MIHKADCSAYIKYSNELYGSDYARLNFNYGSLKSPEKYIFDICRISKFRGGNSMKLRKRNDAYSDIKGTLSAAICVCKCRCAGGRNVSAAHQGWGNNAIGNAKPGYLGTYGFGEFSFKSTSGGSGGGGGAGGFSSNIPS